MDVIDFEEYDDGGERSAPDLLEGYPELMTADEARQVLRVSLRTVRAMCARGDLPCTHIGRRVYIPRRMLAEMIADGCARGGGSL